MGAGELNFRVRDGNGCFLPAMTTGKNSNSLVKKRQKKLRGSCSNRYSHEENCSNAENHLSRKPSIRVSDTREGDRKYPVPGKGHQSIHIEPHRGCAVLVLFHRTACLLWQTPRCALAGARRQGHITFLHHEHRAAVKNPSESFFQMLAPGLDDVDNSKRASHYFQELEYPLPQSAPAKPQ